MARRFPLTAVVMADEAPVDAELHVAWDGHRVLVAKLGSDVRVFADDLRDWSDACQNIVLTVRDLPVDSVVLEGTLCVLDEAGRPDFAALKRRVDTGLGPAMVLMVEDCVFLDGVELLTLARAERRTRVSLPAPLVASAPLQGALKEVLAQVAALGLPGVIAFAGTERRGWAISCGDTPVPLHRTLSKAPTVTSPTKVLFPRDGITKRDVVAWYRDVASVLLPHVRERPVVAQRWPDGIDDFTWFQHRPPPRAPDYLRSAAIDGDRRILIPNEDALLWLVNQAALTFHSWTTRVTSLTSPDWALIDLDPGKDTTWAHVVEIAIAVRTLLELLEVPSVLKTSGHRGLHILVPLAAGQTFDDAQQFAAAVCAMVAQLHPALACLTHDEKERRGRLSLDHLQNFRGKTLAAPYVLRAVDGCPVSTPLKWAELSASVTPNYFTRDVVRERLSHHGDLFASVLTDGCVLERPLARLAGR